MIKYLSITAAITLTITCAAQNLAPEQAAPLIEHMLEVNAEWQHVDASEAKLLEAATFPNENARIAKHLELVEAHLRTTTLAGLSAEQLEKRNAQLDVLNAYWQEGRFPVNLYHSIRQPYFIDHLNTACAVGHLIRESGHEDVAELVHENMNYAYVREIPYSELADWANGFGFTMDELAWVQPGYPPQTIWSGFGTGTDGDVTAILTDDNSNTVYIAGQFTMADGVSCNNVAKWNGSTFEPMGSGLNGITHDLIIFNGELYAGGEFQGGFRDLAKWDGNQWNYSTVFEGKFSMIYDLYEWNGDFLAAGGAAGFAGISYYVAGSSDGSGWSYVGGEFDEAVYALSEHNGSLAAAGAFTQNYDLGGAPIAHVAIYFGTAWWELGDGLDDTVYDLLDRNGTLFAAGNMGTDSLNQKFGLAHLDNGSTTWDIDLNTADYGTFFGEKHLKSMAEVDGELYVGGAFNVGGLLGVYGQNIARWDAGSEYLDPLAVMDNSVLALGALGNSLLMGGKFNSANFTAVNHIARTDVSTSVVELEPNEFSISVGPDQLFIQYQGASHSVLFDLLDVSGKRVLTGERLVNGMNQVGISHLSAGTYILDIQEDGNRLHAEKVVIE